MPRKAKKALVDPKKAFYDESFNGGDLSMLSFRDRMNSFKENWPFMEEDCGCTPDKVKKRTLKSLKF